MHPVFRYWPTLIDRDFVKAEIEISKSSASRFEARQFASVNKPKFYSVAALNGEAPASPSKEPTHLYDIACARSGDKGTSANIGVIARHGKYWDFLRTWLDSERVADYFAILSRSRVDRYELPNVQALNFVLPGILRQSLRNDAQGKSLGQLLLEMSLPADFNY